MKTVFRFSSATHEWPLLYIRTKQQAKSSISGELLCDMQHKAADFNTMAMLADFRPQTKRVTNTNAVVNSWQDSYEYRSNGHYIDGPNDSNSKRAEKSSDVDQQRTTTTTTTSTTVYYHDFTFRSKQLQTRYQSQMHMYLPSTLIDGLNLSFCTMKIHGIHHPYFALCSSSSVPGQVATVDLHNEPQRLGFYHFVLPVSSPCDTNAAACVINAHTSANAATAAGNISISVNTEPSNSHTTPFTASASITRTSSHSPSATTSVVQRDAVTDRQTAYVTAVDVPRNDVHNQADCGRIDDNQAFVEREQQLNVAIGQLVTEQYQSPSSYEMLPERQRQLITKHEKTCHSYFPFLTTANNFILIDQSSEYSADVPLIIRSVGDIVEWTATKHSPSFTPTSLQVIDGLLKSIASASEQIADVASNTNVTSARVSKFNVDSDGSVKTINNEGIAAPQDSDLHRLLLLAKLITLHDHDLDCQQDRSWWCQTSLSHCRTKLFLPHTDFDRISNIAELVAVRSQLAPLPVKFSVVSV